MGVDKKHRIAWVAVVHALAVGMHAEPARVRLDYACGHLNHAIALVLVGELAHVGGSQEGHQH